MPGPVSGSRGNGLPAASWERVAALDPRVADALLDELRTEGIAAYALPGHDNDPIPRPDTGTPRLFDEVWVASGEGGRARVVLDALEGGGPDDTRPGPAEPGSAVDPAGPAADRDFEAAWQDVLSSLQAPAATGRPQPTSDLGPIGGRADAYDADVADDPVYDAGYDPTDSEHYVPPPPPPIPRPGRRTAGALALIAVGVILLFDPLALGSDVSVLLGVLAILGGVVALILNMRDAPPVDHGPDDGAVV